MVNSSVSTELNSKCQENFIDESAFLNYENFTEPKIFADFVKTHKGGYKKIGNIVYVYLEFTLKNPINSTGSWTVCYSFPKPKIPIFPIQMCGSGSDDVSKSIIGGKFYVADGVARVQITNAFSIPAIEGAIIITKFAYIAE